MVKVKRKSGKVVEYSKTKVKNMLKTVGYSGSLLVKATGNVLKEAKKLTKSGVITTVNLEKAVVRGIKNTNDIAVNTGKKITKRVLK